MQNDYLNEKYKIKQKLSKGGFSNTYISETVNDKDKYLIKSLSLNEDPKAVELFHQEANILNKIQHPQIPKFIDFFIDKDQNCNFYIVEELIEGKNLAQLIQEGKYFNESEVIKIGISICEVLEYIHNLNPTIIHQDIKPENIILTPEGKIYLVDFGIAREKILSYQMKNQGLSTILGTQGYMPLEQFEGKSVPASDIYSLGLTLIYLLSHKKPLELKKEGLEFKLKDYINVSDNFRLLLEKMIKVDVEERIQNASALKQQLINLEENKNEKKANQVINVVNNFLPKNEKVKAVISSEVSAPQLFTVLELKLMLATLGILIATPIGMIAFYLFNLLFKVQEQFGSNVNIAIYIAMTFLIPIFSMIFRYYRYYSERDNNFVITDNYLFITNKHQIVKKYSREQLKDLKIRKVIKPDKADLILFKKKKVSEPGKKDNGIREEIVLKLNDIKNIDYVERLIKQIIG